MKLTPFSEKRQSHWERVAGKYEGDASFSRAYHRRIESVMRFVIPPQSRVLELGCGRGDLLAALKPSFGVGVDFSSKMLERARNEHPDLFFIESDVADLSSIKDQFDFIVISDLVNDIEDVQAMFMEVARIADERTRIVINFYSHLWEIPLNLAQKLGMVKPHMLQSWLTNHDINGLLRLSGLEMIKSWQEVLLPVYVPLLSMLFNKYLVKVWPFKYFALTNFAVARLAPVHREMKKDTKPSVTIMVPARNEAGNISHILDRTPAFCPDMEFVFVEGHSKDNTFAAIQEESRKRPHIKCKIFKQDGVGKCDAVRKGFANASGDVLMILDADMTVAPEDLPRFYDALISGKGEFINGVRLVYPMEEKAMRFLNLLGNKFFSVAFTWLLGQPIKDTLCGTKVLWRVDYDRIVKNRSYFGDFDPFGDYDLIFGAAKLNLKIVDLPIRYRERTYGSTQINRWRHGALLIKMVIFAARKIKFI